MLLFRLRFPGFSPSLRPGFPCLPSGSVYSAFCQFPFTLPCFTPTAVPQVLAWLHSPFGSLRFSISPFSFRFLSSASFPGSITQPSVSSFPFTSSPSRWVQSSLLSTISSVCFHTSDLVSVLSLRCDSVLRYCFPSQRFPQQLILLPFGFRTFPLSIHLRFWILGRVTAP